MTEFYCFIRTPIGTIRAVASSTELIEIQICPPHVLTAKKSEFISEAVKSDEDQFEDSPIIADQPIYKKNAILKILEIELEEYFAGQRRSFSVPLAIKGTEFQKKAWQALLKIPYGSVISYSDQSQLMKAPKAMRAVGSANGRNRFPIIIPCHRVIAKKGELGGYTGGLHVKRKLLEIEGIRFTK